MIVLIYSNEDNNSKRYKGKRDSLKKVITKNCNVTTNRKKLYDRYKLKSAAKNTTRTKLRTTKEHFQDDELSHELSLMTRQNFKIKNAFANNLSADIKLSRAQLSKTIIQSVGFLGKTLDNLGEKVLLDLDVHLAKSVLPKLATKATSFAIDEFERKRSRKELYKQEKDLLYLV